MVIVSRLYARTILKGERAKSHDNRLVILEKIPLTPANIQAQPEVEGKGRKLANRRTA
jgi:hypothetical protein